MTTESIITSSASEQRWMNETIRAFTSEVKVDIETTCVFQVPKILSDTKPEAYTPQKIGLGAYHHLRPQFATKGHHKLTIAKSRLSVEQVPYFADKIISKLCSAMVVIRRYYDKHLDLEDQTLAWILAIDSLYMLHLLSSCPRQEIDTEKRMLSQDVMMLENQIPSFVLIEIQKALNQSYSNLFTGLFYEFCKAHSPLRLTNQKKFRRFNSAHLLAYLHHLIINNREIPEEEEYGGILLGAGYGSVSEDSLLIVRADSDNDYTVSRSGMTLGAGYGSASEDSLLIVCADSDNDYTVSHSGMTPSLGVSGLQMLATHFDFLTSLPWAHIKSLWAHIKSMGEKEDKKQKPSVDKIEVPTVTQLTETAKINFKLVEGGIRDIQFDDKNVFYLPEITLNSDSEVILRNLIAYEAAVIGDDENGSSTQEVAEYVNLMCGIVDNPKDVDLLRKSGIIKGSLSDEEIVDLFNGIPKTTIKWPKNNKSVLAEAIDTANQKFDNIFSVKAYRFIKKRIYESRKFLTILTTLVLIMLLTLQAFCQFYGCSNRWFHTPK